MAIKYHLQELPDMLDGKLRVFPKAEIYSQFDKDEVLKRIGFRSGYTECGAKAVMGALRETLLAILPEGHSVCIDGIGTFSLSLTFQKGKNGMDGGQRRIKVKRLNLKLDPEFMRELREKTEFENSMEEEYVPVCKSKGRIDEHRSAALEWVSKNGRITLQEYSNLNHISAATASRELKRLSSGEEASLKCHGNGNRKYWGLP